MSSPAKRGPGRPRAMPEAEYRDAVLAAARHAFASNGMQASIESIAKDAGVSRRSIYETFGDKQELFRQVVLDLGKRANDVMKVEMQDVTEVNPLEWIRSGFSWFFAFLSQYPEARALAALATQEGYETTSFLVQRYTQAFSARQEAGFAQEGIKEIDQANAALLAMFGAMVEGLVNFDWPKHRPDNDVLVELLTQFTAGGLRRVIDKAPHLFRDLN